MSHPIESLMTTAMESIKDMVDVNTIIGDAVQAPDGTVIIPISRVSFGFAAGGGDYNSCCKRKAAEDDSEYGVANDKLPFAGGSGAGVSINPVGFMVVGKEQIRLLPIDMNTSIDRILDLIPGLLKKMDEMICKKMKESKKKHDNAKYRREEAEESEESEEESIEHDAD
ncbi:MAG: GerW family sporulation protein [Eubacteriales bacterium]|nr:GerW family sporulation protein [Eubacteriales bacterium]